MEKPPVVVIVERQPRQVVFKPRLPFREVKVDLASIPKPDFIDHFPRTAEGHGAVPKGKVVGYDGDKPVYRRKNPLCVVGRCQLNSPKNGEKHEKGRSGNAALWMRQVAYDGPSPGIEKEKERPREMALEDRIPGNRCHAKCRLKGVLHAECFLGEPLKAGLMESMLARIDGLPVSRQASRILGEYAGVEKVMQREDVRV